MHTLPVLVAVGIMVSVIFASYQNAYATGLEEYFYYTYFDLMSGLFAETGAHFGLKDDYYTKSDRVSGKQVWPFSFQFYNPPVWFLSAIPSPGLWSSLS